MSKLSLLFWGSVVCCFLGVGVMHYEHYATPIGPEWTEIPLNSSPSLSLNSSPNSMSQSPKQVVIHISGAILKPGIYKFNAEPRCYEVVESAGGFLSNAQKDAVNLVRLVPDGSHLFIPFVSQGGSASIVSPSDPSGHASSVSDPPLQFSLNEASPSQLDELPGVGPSMAKRIVAYRTAHGGFKSLDELRQVKGIGAKKLEVLKRYLTYP